MKKNRSLAIAFTVFLVIVAVFYALVFYSLLDVSSSSYSPGIGSGEAVALIRLDGTIMASENGQLIGSSPENILSQLKQAEDDDYIRAVLLRINSPGGTASSSEEIYTEIKRMKKPVVASIADVGASGAYWIASACDEIVATPSSEVGSIGVILAIPNLKGLFEKIGLEYVVIAKGKYKDIGNPARDLTAEEEKLLSDQAEQIYRRFIGEVAKSRKLPVKKVEELATGQTFIGLEAKELGLIDATGNYNDAVKRAAKAGKIKGEPEIIEMSERDVFTDLMEFIFSSRSQTDILKDLILREKYIF